MISSSPFERRGCAEKGWGCWSINGLTKPREWFLQAALEGGDVLKKGEVVSLITASLSSSRGGDVPDGVRASDEKSE